MNNIWILAEAAANGEGDVIGMEETSSRETQSTTQQDGSNDTNEQGKTPPSPKGSNPMFLIMIAVLGVYMFFIMFLGPKKKQQEHQKMVAAMSKNDRVRTIGGIFGTVLDVRDDEIVLKIDESTNTKMRVSPSAIATVLKDGKSE